MVAVWLLDVTRCSLCVVVCLSLGACVVRRLLSVVNSPVRVLWCLLFVV